MAKKRNLKAQLGKLIPKYGKSYSDNTRTTLIDPKLVADEKTRAAAADARYANLRSNPYLKMYGDRELKNAAKKLKPSGDIKDAKETYENQLYSASQHPDFDPSRPASQQLNLNEDNSLRTIILRGRNTFMNSSSDVPLIDFAAKMLAEPGSAFANMTLDAENRYAKPGLGKGLLNLGTDVLMVAPEIPIRGLQAGINTAPRVGEYLTTQTPLKNTYKYNPWAFKSNPEAYYHRSPNLENIIVDDKLVGFGATPKGKLLNVKGVKKYGKDVIDLTKAANVEPYFSKGIPLDWGRYNKPNPNLAGKAGDVAQGYSGPYLAEATNVPFVAKADGKLQKVWNADGSFKRGIAPNEIGAYAVPVEGSVPLNNLKFYKEHWLKGYKEIPKPKSTQSITRGPIDYSQEPGFRSRNPNFNHEAYVNSAGKFGNTSSGELPEHLKPKLVTTDKKHGGEIIMNYRGKKCMKCGGKPKMQLAGEVQCPPGFKSDGFGNCIPEEPQKFNVTNYAALPSVFTEEELAIQACPPGFKRNSQTGECEIDVPENDTQYFQTGFTKDATGQNQANPYDVNSASYDEAERAEQFSTTNPMVKKPKEEKQPEPKLDPYWLFRGFRNGMSWLSGMVERGRQNRYDWMQQTALGQMNPMPTNDFQPNPYNLYMQKGGNLKNIVKEYNKYTNAAQMDMGDGMVDDQGLMQKGGHVSIVELLAERGQDASFDARKKMFDKYFNNKYSGTAEQNIAMIQMLENPVKDPSFIGARAKAPTKNEPAPRKQVAPPPAKKVEQVKKAEQIKKDTPKSTTFANAIGAAVATISGDRRGTLESGVVVDKGTNTEYVIKGNKIIKSFPVLTGRAGSDMNKDVNKNPYTASELENQPSKRSTPTGTYLMKPNPNIYGWPGYNLQGIPAYGEAAPEARATAMHITYGSDPMPGLSGHPDKQEYKLRNAAYSMSPKDRYMSYGCTNMQGEAIDCLTKEFPKGDTAIYIDSRRSKDKDLIRSFQKEEGGEMKKGGYEIDRMMIMRRILPQLLQLGRLGTSKYRRMQGGGTAFWDNIYKNKPLPSYNFGNAPLYLGRQPNWMDSANYRLFFNDAQRLQNLKSPVSATPANYGWDDYKNHEKDTYLDWKLNESIPYTFINSDKGSKAIRKGDVHNEIQGSVLIEEAAYKDWLNQKNKVNIQFYLPNYPTSKKPKMKKGGLTPNKARQILHDKEVHGKPLTDKQRRYFGAMSKGHTNFRGK